MKKYSLVIITLLCLAVLSACGKESAPALKTEDQIRHDLEQSEHFWYLVAPAATDAYSITDLTIDSRITEPKVSDSVIVAVTAESEYAKYNGVFLVKYLYSESDGYTVDTIYQNTVGSYSEIKLPNDEFATEIFSTVMTYVNGTLQTAEVEEIPSDERTCKLNATYVVRDDHEHCTSQIAAYTIGTFSGGTWQVQAGNIMIGEDIVTVTEETCTYDTTNEVYWQIDPVSGGVELTNAYVMDGHQYYDRYLYVSSADINYKDIIKWGFLSKETKVLADTCYMGCGDKSLISESAGPMDEASALDYIKQIKAENQEILIILDPEEYLSDILYVPGSVIITNQYTDEDGLNVAEVAHKGTTAFN